MGCAISKEVACKRAERESWYAPVSRSVSAPIHYPAESEDDSCHVVSLASSSYGIMEMEKPGDPINKGSFVRILQDKHIILEEKRRSVDLGMHKFLPTHHTKLKPVQELPEMENGDPETINTWELMEGLDEDGAKTPSPLGSTSAHSRCLEKVLSFNTVQELDSCFSEVGSPVWKKYYSNDADVTVKGSIPASQRKKLGGSHHSSLSFSGAEEQLCGDYTGYSQIESPLRTPLKSPAITQVLVMSPMRSPVKIPMMKSPVKSPLVESNSSSPLFDPSLMATFEQALQAITLPQDDWMLLHDAPEESLTNSSVSSGNNTWALSETSSDAESCPPSESVEAHLTSPLHGLSARKREMSLQQVSPWCGAMKMSQNEQTLDSFELRCPPRGEEKVVLYFTSLRGIRKTYEDCCELRLILQGFGVHVDERDVWMHSKFRDELSELFESKRVQVPRLFIKGRYIGAADEVKHLHEDGVLVSLIEDLPCLGMFRKVCEGCADVRFIPCLTCSGSCRVLDAMDQTMRCDKCNENGLIMCPLCS
ncbi:hypothetical protein L7F22_038749 [Adiantum nelumboides]|nr:hypothetical protein [Adiantum nelumboides]